MGTLNPRVSRLWSWSFPKGDLEITRRRVKVITRLWVRSYWAHKKCSTNKHWHPSRCLGFFFFFFSAGYAHYIIVLHQAATTGWELSVSEPLYTQTSVCERRERECLGIRGQLTEVHSLIPPHRSQDLNSNHQVWQQAPLSTEPSYWSDIEF